MKRSKIKIEKSTLENKDLKEMRSYIFDESCICNDNFDRYTQCCGKDRPYNENFFHYDWDKQIITPRFKNILENVQEKILKFYYREMFLIITRTYNFNYQKYLKIWIKNG